VVEGRYRIIKTLGQGGMGTVFLAEHALIKRRVAIKILHQDLATDADVVERFMNEARAAGTLGHPNIVESTDMGFTQEHVPYIVFEFLEGTLLTDEIYRVGGLPVRRTVRIAEQIASALDAAHGAQIVHRDLKSDNVFLTDKDDALDHVKVLDFGISRFLERDEHQRGLVMGTPEFMAPEQITDPDHVDRRADIYALGVIVYEMLTARRPFSNDDDPRRLMHRIVHEVPPPMMRPEVPAALERLVIEKLLAKDPGQRHGSMADVHAALEQFSTRGDGTPLPRRRSAPIKAQTESSFDETPETSLRLPKPAKVRDTPWPVDTLETPMAMGQVQLPSPPPVKRPYGLYGVAGAGIVIGALGLFVGLKKSPEPLPAPAPAIVQHTPQPMAAPMPAPREAEKIEVVLDADAPNATVVFRRRVQPAPVTMQVNATDVVELVEVSAPGYKTTRYWLTFDRPTHLKANLVKGNGSLEATEEQTLVALGEVIMVTGSAPTTEVAAAPVAKAASTKSVERPDRPERAVPAKTASEPAPAAQVALAPRKIGRGGEADFETRSAPAAAPVATTPVAAATEVATTTPAAKPEVAALKPEPSRPEYATAEPVKAVAPSPAKPEPASPAQPAKIATESPRPIEVNAEPARPAIDQATISSVVSANRPAILKCFAEGKKQDPSMKGTITLQLAVDASGKVQRAQVQSTLSKPLVGACVIKAASDWKFPQRSTGGVAQISYPFTIN
jgi:serine/threonine protein kinase